MKPSWTDAPPWAQYLCQDFDSTWWWFESKPEPNLSPMFGHPRWDTTDGACKQAEVPGWQDTLEVRV